MTALAFLTKTDKKTPVDTKKIMQQHLKNLLSLSKVDGSISDTEVSLIYNIGARHGLSREQVHVMIEEASSTTAIIPDNDGDRFEHIFNFVQLMLVDGVVDEKEIDFCISKAESLGFRKAIVGVLVRKISMSIAAGKLDRNAIKNDVGNFLHY